MAGTSTRGVAAVCAEWLAVAGLVVGAGVVLASDPSTAGVPARAEPLDDPSVGVEEPVSAHQEQLAGTAPVWARNGFVPGSWGVLLGPFHGPLLLSGLSLTATAPRGVTDPVEVYVELAPGSTDGGCLAAQTEPPTTRVAVLAGTRTDPAHATASWPVMERLGEASGSWCLVVEVLRSGTRGPAEDAAVTAIVSVDASAPPGTTEVTVPAPSAALLRVPARPAPRRAPRVLVPTGR